MQINLTDMVIYPLIFLVFTNFTYKHHKLNFSNLLSRIKDLTYFGK